MQNCKCCGEIPHSTRQEMNITSPLVEKSNIRQTGTDGMLEVTEKLIKNYEIYRFTQELLHQMNWA